MRRVGITAMVALGIGLLAFVVWFGARDDEEFASLDGSDVAVAAQAPRRVADDVPLGKAREGGDEAALSPEGATSKSEGAGEAATPTIRGSIRVMTRKDFIERLRKLGLSASGDVFEEVRDKRPDRGSVFVLVSNDENHVVRGARVTLDTSKPENLKFHVRGAFSPDVLERRTGFDGVARFRDVKPSPHLLVVDHDDYLPQFLGAIPVTGGERTYVEAVLEKPSAVITGTVVDRRGGWVVGAAVSAQHFTEGAIPFVSSTLTRSDGTFSVGVRKDTQNMLIASKRGYKSGHKDAVFAGTTNVEIVLEDAKTVFVTGFVTRGNSSDPVTQFRVDADQVFDPQGVFRVARDVSPEPQNLVFSADGYAPRTITVTLAEEKDVDIGQVPLFGGKELNGVVLLEIDGERSPLAGASVAVTTDTGEQQGMTTSADGLFSFSGLATEGVQLAVTASGVSPYHQQVTLLEEGPTYVEVVLQPGDFNVTGRILDDETDEPIEGALVAVVERAGLTATTNAEGEYEILGIGLPQFTLRATKEGYKEGLSPMLAGSEEGAYWEGRLEPEGVRFKLRVNGQPAPSGVTVFLWKKIAPTLAAAQAAQASLGDYRFQAVTDAEGMAAFDVANGNYFLHVPSYRLDPKPVTVDTETTHTVTTDLPGLTQLQGQILYADGSPVANTSLWLHSGDQDYSTMFLYHTDASGHYTIPHLAPRPYALSIIKSVSDQSAQHVREVTATGAPTQAFNVTFPPLTATITGQVVDQNGVGKSGVKVGVEYLDAPHRSIIAGWVSTDETGHFVVPHLEPGNHIVRTAWTEDVCVFSEVITLTPGQNATVTLVAPTTPGLHIQGNVIASDGGPLGPNFLFVTDPQGRQNGNFFSTMDWAYVGSFDIKGLAPGLHTVTATAMGAQKKQITAPAGASGLVVTMAREN